MGFDAKAPAQHLPIYPCRSIRFGYSRNDRLKDVFTLELEDGDEIERLGA
ncbi:hypothetical protein J2046_002990 [Rhizobium petrolearium]|nr:hypothetical protein [Neorhizobium petrolearium]MBP1844723.1 hypothetical protein [Neorhizobium petrolearium]